MRRLQFKESYNFHLRFYLFWWILSIWNSILHMFNMKLFNVIKLSLFYIQIEVKLAWIRIKRFTVGERLFQCFHCWAKFSILADGLFEFDTPELHWQAAMLCHQGWFVRVAELNVQQIHQILFFFFFYFTRVFRMVDGQNRGHFSRYCLTFSGWSSAEARVSAFNK